jgi:hypothetical protein
MPLVNLDYARKNEGLYYGDGAARLGEAIAEAAYAAKPLGCDAIAESVYAVLRHVSQSWGQNPDIETFMRPEGRSMRVSWESGPYSWATVASEALCQIGILAEPYYNFDLCFYPEN